MLVAQKTGTSVDDRYGNRWQQTPSGFLATFNGNNNRIDGYTYDAAGNLLSDGTNHYTYDAENRLISYSNTAGAAASYVYDALGQRVEKTSNTPNECSASGTVFYIRDLSGHVAVYTVSGVNQCHDEIFAGGRHLVTYEGRATFNHSDWLGTERLRIVSAYVSLPKYDEPYTSYPFGDALTGNLAPPYGGVLHFTGQPHDLESNLEYFGARYYGSNIGRFISPDPENAGASDGDPQSWNAFTYATNDPVNVTDLDGLSPNACEKDPDHCVVVTASTIDIPLIATRLAGALEKTVSYLDQAWNWYRTSQVNTGCVAASTAAGAAYGASRGVVAGPIVQGALALPTGGLSEAAGGPAGGALAGGLLGAAGGAAAGAAVGQIACRTGAGGSGGGRGGTGGGGRKWKLGANKTPSRWANQMRQRGWTEAQIDDAINHGQQFPATNNINPANGATRFVNPTSGQSVVMDNVTGEVIHVGGPGFQY